MSFPAVSTAAGFDNWPAVVDVCLIPEGWNGHLSNYQAACQSASSHKCSSLVLLVLVGGVTVHFSRYGNLGLGCIFQHAHISCS